jgi:hypothetical protein
MGLSNGTTDGLVLTSLILQGLAGGTLIYVAFFEVLERERTKPSNKLMQWVTVLLGFLLMIGLEALSKNFISLYQHQQLIYNLVSNRIVPEHEHGDHDHHENSTEESTSNIPTLASAIGSQLLGFHSQHNGHGHTERQS